MHIARHRHHHDATLLADDQARAGLDDPLRPPSSATGEGRRNSMGMVTRPRVLNSRFHAVDHNLSMPRASNAPPLAESVCRAACQLAGRARFADACT
jgi:hypothetical protein